MTLTNRTRAATEAHLVYNHVQLELDAVSLLLTDVDLLVELLAKFLEERDTVLVEFAE